MKTSEYYFCRVGPASGQVYASPGASYRLAMEAPVLRAPSQGGSHHQAVISSDELEVLRRRGFTVELLDGPFSSESKADDRLDDWWEDSHRMGGDD